MFVTSPLLTCLMIHMTNKHNDGGGGGSPLQRSNIVIANVNDNTRDRQLPAERWLAESNGRLSAAAGIRRHQTIRIAAMAKMADGMRAQPPCKDIDTINGPQKRAKIRGIMTSFDNCELRRLRFIIIIIY
ncbi:hypothetical protein QTP88_018882 [Uroleucon formosanum]